MYTNCDCGIGDNVGGDVVVDDIVSDGSVVVVVDGGGEDVVVVDGALVSFVVVLFVPTVLASFGDDESVLLLFPMCPSR